MFPCLKPVGRKWQDTIKKLKEGKCSSGLSVKAGELCEDE
jgi:hypothetical protein